MLNTNIYHNYRNSRLTVYSEFTQNNNKLQSAYFQSFTIIFFKESWTPKVIRCPPKNRPQYHLRGPTAPFMYSSYCKQAPPTVNMAPPTVNMAPPTVNWASYCKRGSSYCERSSSYSKIGSSYCKLGSSYYKHGSSYYKLGSSYCKRGFSYCKHGSSYCKCGSSY